MVNSSLVELSFTGVGLIRLFGVTELAAKGDVVDADLFRAGKSPASPENGAGVGGGGGGGENN